MTHETSCRAFKEVEEYTLIAIHVPNVFTSFSGFPVGLLDSQEREVELGKRRKLFSVYDVHEEIGR